MDINLQCIESQEQEVMILRNFIVNLHLETIMSTVVTKIYLGNTVVLFPGKDVLQNHLSFVL